MVLVCDEESNVFPAILAAINTFLGRLKMKEHRSVKIRMSSKRSHCHLEFHTEKISAKVNYFW